MSPFVLHASMYMHIYIHFSDVAYIAFPSIVGSAHLLSIYSLILLILIEYFLCTGSHESHWGMVRNKSDIIADLTELRDQQKKKTLNKRDIK